MQGRRNHHIRLYQQSLIAGPIRNKTKMGDVLGITRLDLLERFGLLAKSLADYAQSKGLP